MCKECDPHTNTGDTPDPERSRLILELGSSLRAARLAADQLDKLAHQVAYGLPKDRVEVGRSVRYLARTIKLELHQVELARKALGITTTDPRD